MTLRIYQVDAFAETVFSGNPAAVCPLEEWLDDATLQKIAIENNLAETAFYVKDNDRFHIRWFTPTIEVDLCGHATLASAFVLFHYEGHPGNTIQFWSHRSGDLPVVKNNDFLTLNFPVDSIEPIAITPEIRVCFEIEPLAAYKGKTDFLVVFPTEEDILNLQPALDKIAALGGRGLIATAKGNEVDFVSRFFAPQAGINEDRLPDQHTLH